MQTVPFANAILQSSRLQTIVRLRTRLPTILRPVGFWKTRSVKAPHQNRHLQNAESRAFRKQLRQVAVVACALVAASSCRLPGGAQQRRSSPMAQTATDEGSSDFPATVAHQRRHDCAERTGWSSLKSTVTCLCHVAWLCCAYGMSKWGAPHPHNWHKHKQFVLSKPVHLFAPCPLSLSLVLS